MSDDFPDQMFNEPEATDTKLSAEEKTALESKIIEALKQIYDPEIPVNIYDLALIYNIDIDDTANVVVDMTLTTPGCPVAETFPLQVQDNVLAVEGVNGATINLIWDPPWTPERLSEEVKLQLGFL